MKRIAFLAALLVLTPANAQITRIPVMVDGSGTVATGGTSQQVFAADQYRNYLMCMNPSSATEKLYIEYGAAASTTNGKSIPLDPGGVAQFLGMSVPTASDATWSVTFDTAFASTPIYADARVYGSTTPYICTVSSLSATAASGKCFQLVTTTLPTLATSLLGLVVSPFVTAGSGLSVRVVARQ